jgi:hypothetical protein
LKVRVVFVSESVFIAAPLDAAKHRLLEYFRLGDMVSLASEAYGEGVTVFTQAGVGGLAKTVAIESVPAYDRGPATVIPLRWTATGPLGSAFPVLDANVELTGSEMRTDLLVVGTYRPPFGALGVALDRLVMHGVAQATIRRFALQLAEIAGGTTAA